MSENEAAAASLRVLTREKDYARLEALIAQTEDTAFLVAWIDENGFALLHWCAIGGLPSALLRLLEAGADPNARGPNSQTPLMWAAMTQQLLCMQILADHGANILLRDELGDNALNIACQQESIYSIMWLINRHSPINQCNVVGTSAAHWASFSGSYMTLSLLDAYGFDMLTVYDRNGCLPLHKLLELEFWGTARMLVTLNPQLLLAATKDGKTLSEFAVDRCLPNKTFNDWWKLCQNRLHKTDGAKASASGDAEEGGGEAGAGLIETFGKLRRRVWLAFIDFVDKLEARNSTKGFIPLIAYSFALSFAVAHYCVLWRYNETLIETMASVPLLRVGSTLLLRLSPWLGVLAIGVFCALLLASPGYVPPNYFSRIVLPRAKGAEDARAADVAAELAGEDDVKLWAPLKRVSTYLTTLSRASEHMTVDLTDEKGAASVIAKLRHRRKEMFEAFLQTVNSLEAQVLLSPDMLASDSDRLLAYLHAKGCSVTFAIDGDKHLRPVMPYYAERALRDKLSLRRVCPTCWIRRNMRTKHCSVCDRCCRLMDHHCVWINNCVGKENHLLFAVFVFAASISQWHQVFLILCSPLMAARRHDGSVAGWLLVMLAAALHFITSRWGLSLLAAQAKDVVDGTTVNETINASRYDHFIVSSRCDEAGLPAAPMLEEECLESICGTISEGRVERKPLQKVTKTGEVVPAAENVQGARVQEARVQEARVLEDVADLKQKMEGAAAPEIVDEAKAAPTAFIRRFVRNPFSEHSRWVNAWRFATNTRAEEIDYAALDDDSFLSKMRAEILRRRAVLGKG